MRPGNHLQAFSKKLEKTFFIVLHMLRKRLIQAFWIDVALSLFSLPTALALRLGLDVLDYPKLLLAKQTLVFAGITAGTLLMTASFKSVWRYTSLYDLGKLVVTVLMAETLFLPYLSLSGELAIFPLGALAIQSLILGGAWVMARLCARALFNYQKRSTDDATKALVFGINSQSELLVRQLLSTSKPAYTPLGFIEDQPKNVDRYIHGIPVLGSISNIQNVCAKLLSEKRPPEVMFVCSGGLKSTELNTLSKAAQEMKLRLIHLPSPRMFGSLSTPKAKPVSVENLIHRQERPSDTEPLRALLRDKKLLVTGAGGSIGKECVMQLARFFPKKIIFTDNNEHALYQTALSLSEAYPNLKHAGALLDIRHAHFVNKLFQENRPDFVFHAAALKHVPIVEAQPIEALLTNVLGTKYVADAAQKAGSEGFVLVSTDKAVKPKSLMGSTKHIAEMYCQYLDSCQKKSSTFFSIVRFGNVLGSSGSVIPLFQRQIEMGGPVTVTHPDVTRYFMTMTEAAQLIIQTLHLKTKTLVAPGGIFTLDMGEPLSILDLAETMIRLSGHRPYEDIPITFTGLRPGEKIHEDLVLLDERQENTLHPHITLSCPNARRLNPENFQNFCKDLDGLAENVWRGNEAWCQKFIEKYAAPQKSEKENIATPKTARSS